MYSFFTRINQRIRWHHVYYILALIDIVTIVATLQLTQVLTTTYEKSIDENKQMSLNISEFVKLSYITQAVNEPGNRVFDSKNIAAEKLLLEQNYTWFHTAFRHAKSNLEKSFNQAQLDKIHLHIDNIQLEMTAMVGASYQIFEALEQDRPLVAAEFMSKMDAKFYLVTQNIGEVTQYISDIQNRKFEKQVQKAKEISQYEIIIFSVVLIIVTFVTLFGHRLGKQLKRNERQLHNALETSKRSAAAKEQFLANMSHEIRTPMNATLSLLQLIDKQALSKEHQNFLNLALKSSENLLHIINDILNLSKIESGAIQFERVDFNIKTLLDNQFNIYKESYTQSEVQISLDTSKVSAQWVNGDFNRLTQVITNLLNNAYKFTSQGQIKIVACTEKTDTSPRVKIDVIDSGIGISEHKLETIFNPFAQEDASTTRQFGGTGLGLAISRKICEQMNGYLIATSEKGKGSTFTIKVSFDHAESPKEITETTNQNDSFSQEQTFNSLDLHLLVAEDNKVNQLVIKQILLKMGCTSDIVNDGNEAIEQLNESHIAILMDCMMPQKDGYQATKEIRLLDSSFKNIPIIALTANSLEGDKEKCLAAGMNDYLSKPIEFEKLYSKLLTLKTQKES